MRKYAIDLDGVVFDYVKPFLLHCKIEHNIDFTDNDMCVDNFVQSKFGKINGGKLIDSFNDHNKYLSLPVIKYAVQSIRELSFQGDIYIITSRDSKYRMETVNTLLELGIDFRDLFIGEDIDKLSIMRALNIDTLIEDNGPLCSKSANSGIRSYCFEAGYNKIYRERNNKIIPVTGWLDVLAGEVRLLKGNQHGRF